jgi:hypothetical protein
VAAADAAGERLVYRPALLGSAQLHFVRARNDVDEWKDLTLLAPLAAKGASNPWEGAEALEGSEPSLLSEAEEGGEFARLPAAASRPQSYATWKKKLATHLYRCEALTLWRCRSPKATSEPGESEGDFRVRMAQAAREKRDLQLQKVKSRYAPKLARLQERIRKAEVRVSREKSQYSQQKAQTAISVGATILGALLGRKTVSTGSVGRATTAMRGMGRAARERGDIARALEEVKVQQGKLAGLAEEFQEALAKVQEPVDPLLLEIEPIEIKPRKSDTDITRVALVWTPWRVDDAGLAEPAYS